MRVLVTGAARFPEEALVAALCRLREAAVPGGPLEARSLRLLFELHRPHVVVNVAGPAAEGTDALLEMASAFGLTYLVHLSSADLYGAAPGPDTRAREDEPVDPQGDPALEALAAAEEAVRACGIPALIFRAFGLLGPGMPVDRFPRDVFEAIHAGADRVTVPAGRRDLLHVDDAADAVQRALRRQPRGETLNLGSGSPVSPADVARELARRQGRELREVLERPWARPVRIADMEKAWTVLGFAPRRSVNDALGDLGLAVAPRESRDGEGSHTAGERPVPPPERPAPLSRRELFGIFRRPR